jgi:predicted permease
MESLVQDIKFSLKLLWKDKGFAATAVATLALCIGANTAIFSVIYAVVLRPLPIPESDRILVIYNSYPKAGVLRASSGVPDYFDRLHNVQVFEEQALFNTPRVTVGEKGSVEQLRAMGVTPSFFRLLRIKPRIGRFFTGGEGEPGKERKVILSYALWQGLYGGQESALGKDLRIYGNPYTIVGVMPREFVFLDPEVMLWRPLAFTPEQKADSNRHSNSYQMIGRLKPGATLEQAQAQIDAINAVNLERFPEMREVLINAGFHTRVVSLQDDVIRDVKSTLILLWGGVLFVLLIGAVNIANIVLARSSARTRELATRFALGAGRWRVTRQLLTESVLLTGLSALCGLFLGYWGLKLLNYLGLDRIPRANEVALDGVVVVFILGLAFIVGLAIGLIPLVQALHVNLTSVFRQDGRSGAGRGARVLRRSLAVVQVAIALVLLVGAGLLLASFRHVLAINPGFKSPERVLSGSVSLPAIRYRGDNELRAFMSRALESLHRLPGVMDAGATDTIPFGGNTSDSVILAEGYTMKPGESLVSPYRIVVTPGYFEAMRIPRLQGRFFDQRDTEAYARVVIVDDRLARKFWGDTSPIGKRMWRPSSAQDFVHPDEKSQWYTVVGVVHSVKIQALVDTDERVGAYFFPYAQSPRSMITFALRSASEPSGLVSGFRGRIAELDQELPLYDIRTMERRTEESLTSRRSPMILSISFGLVALFLAAVGIYGVLAYMVAQRTKEIGIRVAMGSTPQGIFRLILGEGVLILAIGFVLGLCGALSLAKYVQSLLYGVRPLEPAVLAPVLLLLALVTLAACCIPARRATRVDPITALRCE